MAYAITHGTDPAVPAQRRETATAALELVKLLEAEKKKPNIKITDWTGAVLTVPDLERLSGKENLTHANPISLRAPVRALSARATSCTPRVAPVFSAAFPSS